jgi:hypothetical protein
MMPTLTIEQHSLQQHLAVSNAKARILQARAAGRTLEEIDFYPARPARDDTPGFEAIKHEVIVERNTPCHICGVTHSLLSDPAKHADPKLNPWGASQMELHHCQIEKQLGLAIDPEKFNAKVFPWLHRVNPTAYPEPLSEAQLLDWVDHGIENMEALCDVHHRHKYLGVHCITYPIWRPMDLVKPDFDAFVLDTLKQQFSGPPTLVVGSLNG